MRIIFSRKGFDSGAGGCASPILDGECISLPIPTSMPSPTTFADLSGPHGDLVEDLTKGRIGRDRHCHVDPDIDGAVLPRKNGWRGALGQVAAAQGHLERNAVGVGDVFLFWGVFRPVRRAQRWVFDGPAEHRIFGWLQVGEAIQLGSDGSHALDRHSWLSDHPHVRAGWSKKNTLYVATDQLGLNGVSTSLPGWGRCGAGHRLTAAAPEGANVSPGKWHVPTWLNPKCGGSSMTYHGAAERWDAHTVQVVSRGQEFVADVGNSPEAAAWLEEVLRNA
ncbi:MAG: hypothetical protein AB7E80_03980 [Hyphomicrobiaceae bacterium]